MLHRFGVIKVGVTDICGLAGQNNNCDGIISVEKNMEEINGRLGVGRESMFSEK